MALGTKRRSAEPPLLNSRDRFGSSARLTVCVDVRVLDRREARWSELDVLVEVGVLDHSKVDSASVRRDR